MLNIPVIMFLVMSRYLPELNHLDILKADILCEQNNRIIHNLELIDRTARMCRLICDFVVCMQQSWVSHNKVDT